MLISKIKNKIITGQSLDEIIKQIKKFWGPVSGFNLVEHNTPIPN